MAWSTSELAGLAGTSVSTIRFYHRKGLLDEPERESNGYKQYETRHLMRVLRLKRLSELGVPLAEIAEIESEGRTTPDLSHIDAELEATIMRLQRVREELADIARSGAPVDLPPSFNDIAGNLSARHRTLVMVCSRVFGADVMRELHRQFSKPRTSADLQFDALEDDAATATREDLAAQLFVDYRHLMDEEHGLPEFFGPTERVSDLTQRVLSDTFASIYNDAQIDVCRRLLAHIVQLGEAH
jgi:DNA-binding transcriptional MerR regulator